LYARDHGRIGDDYLEHFVGPGGGDDCPVLDSTLLVLVEDVVLRPRAEDVPMPGFSFDVDTGLLREVQPITEQTPA
jgi:hypothetical protein